MAERDGDETHVLPSFPVPEDCLEEEAVQTLRLMPKQELGEVHPRLQEAATRGFAPEHTVGVTCKIPG